MSSGNMPHAQHPALFRWAADLDPNDYIRARYRVTSIHDGDATAMAMAMEQSCGTSAIAGHVVPEMLGGWSARVLRVQAADTLPASELHPYHLATEVYADHGGAERDWLVELAIPRCLLAGKPAQLLNVAVGELPRLGFLTRFQLQAMALPDDFGPGPSFGIAGIRRHFRRAKGPLLCRAMRPAVGLDLPTMAGLHRAVLVGGFHLVKDDELQVFTDNQAYRKHVQAMVSARDEARDRTGEFKGYLANLICEPWELAERWDILDELGVDAALVAPAIQGLGVLSMLAREARRPLLAHNSFSDLLTRHPRWGIAPPVLEGWVGCLGADWHVTSGTSGQAVNSDPTERLQPPARTMPILQGGKHPQGLPDYRASVGSDDYMLIVASWVDAYPDGLEAGARVFREAVDAQHA